MVKKDAKKTNIAEKVVFLDIKFTLIEGFLVPSKISILFSKSSIISSISLFAFK